ncbi:hypothetical protein H2O64_19805 [Kordia sp. YSTF-M3]|uniref:Uncharacterized protein n=1 Tax=Kordia aestuariivivens TaxID=2759037 RepID=A0ABR7QEC6_9FLAO|nr:hypothetical protein [Kordia aestuariivivens]MBC8756927.1 hypothetical protein [Kordia aestuariivivens]
MEYKFKIYIWDGTTIMGVKSNHSFLENIRSWDWTSQKVQKIIDGVEKHKTLPDNDTDNPFVWGNEDVSVMVNENGVTLLDTLAIRAGESSQDKIVLGLTHEVFLKFLKDFKTFVEENS